MPRWTWRRNRVVAPCTWPLQAVISKPCGACWLPRRIPISVTSTAARRCSLRRRLDATTWSVSCWMLGQIQTWGQPWAEVPSSQLHIADMLRWWNSWQNNWVTMSSVLRCALLFKTTTRRWCAVYWRNPLKATWLKHCVWRRRRDTWLWPRCCFTTGRMWTTGADQLIMPWWQRIQILYCTVTYCLFWWTCAVQNCPKYALSCFFVSILYMFHHVSTWYFILSDLIYNRILHSQVIQAWTARRLPSHRTPLLIAAEAASLEVLELLLKAHADPNAQDTNGCDAVYTAAQMGHVYVLRHLLDSRAAIVLGSSQCPLSVARENGFSEIVQLLSKGSWSIWQELTKWFARTDSDGEVLAAVDAFVTWTQKFQHVTTGDLRSGRVTHLQVERGAEDGTNHTEELRPDTRSTCGRKEPLVRWFSCSVCCIMEINPGTSRCYPDTRNGGERGEYNWTSILYIHTKSNSVNVVCHSRFTVDSHRCIFNWRRFTAKLYGVHFDHVEDHGLQEVNIPMGGTLASGRSGAAFKKGPCDGSRWCRELPDLSIFFPARPSWPHAFSYQYCDENMCQPQPCGPNASFLGADSDPKHHVTRMPIGPHLVAMCVLQDPGQDQGSLQLSQPL